MKRVRGDRPQQQQTHGHDPRRICSALAQHQHVEERHHRYGEKEQRGIAAAPADGKAGCLEGEQARSYEPIVPQGGRWPSRILDLDLSLEGGQLRFFHGNAPLLEAAELVDSLGKMLDEVLTHKQEAEERARAAEEQMQAAKERAEIDAKRSADLERQLQEAQAEIARLKGGGG